MFETQDDNAQIATLDNNVLRIIDLIFKPFQSHTAFCCNDKEEDAPEDGTVCKILKFGYNLCYSTL